MIVDEVVEWCKCGSGPLSALPTVLWAAGAAALARRLLLTLFRRSVFRRAPYWELALQHLLLVWMVVYSVHLWVVLVRLLKLLVGLAYDQTVAALYEPEQFRSPRHKYVLQQCAVWCASAAPLAACARARRRPRPPPLMICGARWARTGTTCSGRRPPPPRAPRRAFSAPQLAAHHNHNTRKHSKSI